MNTELRVLSDNACELRNDLCHLRPVEFARYQVFHEAFRNAVKKERPEWLLILVFERVN